MPKKVEEKLYILTPYRGYINPLKMVGPVVHPIKVTKLAATDILMSGAEVYEFIPETKETIKLTLENINNRKEPIKITQVTSAPVTPVTVQGVPRVEESLDTIKDEAGNEVDVPAGDVNDEPAEIVSEEPAVENVDESTGKEDIVSTFAFEYNEDGTVNESVINWSSFSKNERKAIRARITEHNATVTNN